MMNEELYLLGSKDNTYIGLDHSYIIVEVKNCDESTRNENDPECAPRDEINEWIDTKVI